MYTTPINRRPTTASVGLSMLTIVLAFAPVGSPAQQARGERPFVPIEDAVRLEPVTSGELNDARILFGRLEEQVRIASAKLAPAALDRKKQVGTYRSLLSAVDSRIAVISAQIQMQQERQRQIRENQLARRDDASAGAGFDELVKRAEAPAKRLRAELERLTRRRAQLQVKVDALQDQQIRYLLEAAVQPAAPALPEVDALDSILEEMLGETAASASGNR